MKIDHVQNRLALNAPAKSAATSPIGAVSNNSINSTERLARPHSVISFGGLKNKGHVLHVLAELPPWMKVGGVATVGKDYMNMADWFDALKAQNPDIAAALGDGSSKVSLVIPYYNGVIGQDGSVSVREIAGQPVWISEADAKKYAYNPEGLAADKKAVTHLKEVVSSDMQWGATKSTPVKLFQIVDHPALAGRENVDVYMLYTEGAARMPKAYANGAYCSEPQTAELAKRMTASDSLRAMAPDDRVKSLTDAYTSSQPYHMYSKGVVEAIEKAGIDAETIICSDSQTMLVPEFIAQRYEKGDEFFKGAKTTGVFHNTGAVYCGECSARDIFLAEATPEQIEMVRKSPEYIFAREIGREEDYFKRFIPGFIDDNGNVNPNMAMLRHVENGHGYVNTVSQEYAKSMASDPAVTPLQSLWKELYEKDKVGGIINGFEDPGVSAFKKLGLGGYTTEHVAMGVQTSRLPYPQNFSIEPYVTYDLDDMRKAIEPSVEQLKLKDDASVDDIGAAIKKALVKKDKFNTQDLTVEIENAADGKPVLMHFDPKEEGVIDRINALLDGAKKGEHKIKGVSVQREPLLRVSDAERDIIRSATEPTLETARIAKRHNKISFLERFAYDADNKFAIAGLPNRKLSLMGTINPSYIDEIAAGKDIPLFVSWGRGDFQKGHPIALESFMKFAKTKEGENALLVLGGELPQGANETKRILELMEKVNADSSLKGRIVFIDGFAPGYAMSSAADFSLFTSRFEPCGLTDLEAQKYFATPITLNTQGFAQKVFDPRTAPEGSIINGYKSTNEFYMPKEKVQNIIDLFATKTKVLDDAAREGLKKDFPYSGEDISRFEQFGAEFQKLLAKAKESVFGMVSKTELDKQALVELESMPEYSDLIQRLKEGILTDEIAAAMKQGVADAADPAMAETIFKNQLALNSEWLGNVTLNGIDRQTGRAISSAELYCRRHVMPDASAAAPRRIFQFREDLVNAKLDLGEFAVPGGDTRADVSGFRGLPAAGSAVASSKGTTAVDGETIEALSASVRALGDKIDSVADAIKNTPAQIQSGARQAATSSPSFGRNILASIGNTISDRRVLAAVGALAAIGAVAALATAKVKTNKDAKAVSAPQNTVRPLNTTQAADPQSQPAYQAPAPVVLTPDNRFANHFQKMA